VLDAVEVWPSERVGVKTGPMMNELRDKAQWSYLSPSNSALSTQNFGLLNAELVRHE
jgi:hypothetical protein